MKTKEELAKKSRKFTLIKRQADEPTIVIASDWGGEEIPWNKLIEVEESSRVSLLESRIKELQKKLNIAVEALEHTDKFCLCERETKGFDYHEFHPLMGKSEIGTRWKTPRYFISEALRKIRGENETRT